MHVASSSIGIVFAGQCVPPWLTKMLHIAEEVDHAMFANNAMVGQKKTSKAPHYKGGLGLPKTNAVSTQQTPHAAFTHTQPAKEMRMSLRVSVGSLGKLERRLGFGYFLLGLLQLLLQGSVIFHCNTDSSHTEQINFYPVLTFNNLVIA